MTEDELPRPPYSADLLADLHAGALDDDVTAGLWPAVRRDPDAMAVIAALDSVSRRLRALGAAEDVESPPIPPEVAARIDAALTADAAARRRRRWLLAAAGTGAAAAVAIGFAVTAHGAGRPEAAAPMAAPAAAAPASAAPGADVLDPATWRAMIGASDPGPLSDHAVLRECLEANGIDESRPLLGSRTIRFDGREAVALVLGDAASPRLTALVVGTGCGASDPATLVIRQIG
ncbi:MULTISPECIES: hypothetical protein [unclassified Rhodococcus (in: high G+C Gram-positive bacteria)]|uniref:hypothetical protein n=1 Tax=unclassified Rhodococcus (in: high G+C Gram-positive bacteria) TaxID=192944 RepID=UPI000926FB3D|nr:hypothetical protein [Rhodococcus sp. M8]OLL19863.1 hypothetical protein BKE56_007620 [Rhodococcus sp. M8]QPG43704.1 hypothetical protein ISO16_17225 [Rhodococcus sp. M8]